jgi:predicted amidohydrolase YtcJ
VSVAFVGGHYYVTGLGPRRGGVAVSQGRVLAVGTDAEVIEAAGPTADVVDTTGGLVSPGFGDAHLHPIIGGMELAQCSLDHCTSADECLQAIADYAAGHPDQPWILGGGWSVEHFPGGTPHKDELDRIVPDRPVFLRNSSHHGAWVSSRALELAGISASTPDPADGRIERDRDGSPTGTLHEGAVSLVQDVAPRPTRRSLYEGLLRAQEHCLALGITHWQDALLREMGPDVEGLHPYVDALAADTLVARVTGALWWDRHKDVTQIGELLDRAAGASGHEDRFKADAVKIMVDGVMESFTASLSRPYLDRCGHATDNYGISFFGVDTLKDVVATVDAHGLQAHFHSLGDQAVADSLDAVAHAQRVNGRSGLRHHLAHLQVVRPEDVRRWSELEVIANIQPLWARFEPQMTELTIPFIDPDLAAWQYPFADLHRAGARLAAGSDWPVSSADPIEGIHVAVNRTAEHSPPDAEPFLPHQRLPLVVAWDAYTSGVAFLNGREDDLGRLEPGYAADLVVLDRDPFTGAPHEISETRVSSTWVDGRCVFERRA